MMKKIIAVLLLTVMLASSVFAAPSRWAKTEVETAVKEKLVPEILLSDYQNTITREEFCIMVVKLYTALSGNEPQKGDAVFSDTQNEDVMKAYSLGIVNGMGEGIFAPNAFITREEIATMYYRTINAALPGFKKAEKFVNIIPDMESVSGWAADAVKFANMCEVMIGDEKGNVNPKQNTTREQAIAMTLRIYKALKAENSLAPEISMFFSTSGNTSVNMQGGAFAVMSLYGGMYFSDNKGVYSANGETVTKEKALVIYPDTDCVYYVREADKSLYKVSGGIETLVRKDCVSFSVSGEYIYIKDSAGKLFSLKDGAETLIGEGVISVPMSTSNGVYYADGKGINLYKNTGERELVYEGTAEDAVLQSGVFYFKNEKGFVCKVDTNGENKKVLTPVAAEKFSVYSSKVLYMADGLYKCSTDGRFNIKILDETNFTVNNYGDKIYLKEPNGTIFELNTFTAVKTAIN